MDKKKNIPVVITGLICITALEIVALLMGLNGTLLKIVLVAIATTIGLKLNTPKFLK